MVIRKSNSWNRSTPVVLEQQLHAARGVPAGSEERGVQSGPIRILRLAKVLDVTGLGKTKIYELQTQGNFPMRVQITQHSVGWIENEVQEWLATRVATRRAAAPIKWGV